ncbi:MAG TPA: universal stress protein [Thermoanaerobaculia bacterium]|nr:universal stress protein [Thermoanaerobaculia bacterium]
MFRKLLVPVDFTASNQAALAAAASLAAEPDGVEITLLHVIETLAGVTFEEEREFYERLEGRARAGMEELAARLDLPPERVRREVVYGRRAPEVVAYAEREGCDLIVLSSHRVDPQSAPGSWATLSYSIAVLALCPVLLVK